LTRIDKSAASMLMINTRLIVTKIAQLFKNNYSCNSL